MKIWELYEEEKSVARLFARVADAQRGAPERIMVQIQFYLGGGVFPFVIEHVGDLTHRMSEQFEFMKGGREYVQNKVEKTLRTLQHNYGFQKEMMENMRNSYDYYVEEGKIDPTQVPYEDWLDEAKQMSRAYADAHRKVPVYNEVQQHARAAAVALGEWQFSAAIAHLWWLKRLLDDGDRYEEEVAKVTQDTTEGMDDQFLLTPDIEAKTNYPLPTNAKKYKKDKSKRRGGAKVRVRTDPNSFENVV